MNSSASHRLPYENPDPSNSEKVKHAKAFVAAYEAARAEGLTDEENAEWLEDMKEEREVLEEKPLISPRVILTKRSLPPREGSMWNHMKDSDDSSAWLKMFAMTRNMFDLICDTCDLLGELDEYRPKEGKRGPKRVLSVRDVLAICVRQFLCPPVCNLLLLLAMFFGVSQTAICRALNTGTDALLRILRVIPLASIGYPDEDETVRIKNAWKGLRDRFGEAPLDLFEHIAAFFIDGTTTPGCRHRIPEIDNLMWSHKYGQCWQMQLVVSMLGTVVDFCPAWLGCTHDSRAGIAILARFQQAAGKWAMITDIGYKNFAMGFHKVTPVPGVPLGFKPIFRPMGLGTYVIPELRDWVMKCSKWFTALRQCNEMVNGGIKRTFPRILHPMRFEERDDLRRNSEIVIRLWNYRTRVLGFNEVKTISSRRTDPFFCAALRCTFAMKSEGNYSSQAALKAYTTFLERHVDEKPTPYASAEAFEEDVAACEEQFHAMLKEMNGDADRDVPQEDEDDVGEDGILAEEFE